MAKKKLVVRRCPKDGSLSTGVVRSKPNRDELKCKSCGHRWRVKIRL